MDAAPWGSRQGVLLSSNAGPGGQGTPKQALKKAEGNVFSASQRDLAPQCRELSPDGLMAWWGWAGLLAPRTGFRVFFSSVSCSALAEALNKLLKEMEEFPPLVRKEELPLLWEGKGWRKEASLIPSQPWHASQLPSLKRRPFFLKDQTFLQFRTAKAP